MKNIFCSIDNLKNEADVETFFINRMLVHLGYEDADIKLKTSISEYEIGKGSKKTLYKPDYVILINGIPSIVIDAKSPNENIINWEHQCSSYCLEINKEFDYNPVNYYILSNGNTTNLYRWDQKKPLLELGFDDFYNDSFAFMEFENYLSKSSMIALVEHVKEELDNSHFLFEKVSLEELSTKFQKLHEEIWKSEKKGPSAAFQELIKIFFVKIRKDRDIHIKLGSNPKPKYKDVIFSQNWIASQTETNNPINQILFKNLLNELEKDIIYGNKKRFFDKNEQINISSSTMKKVVKEIENIDLYGMEEDVHGRMFETFLDATIRGKDIGQFFTPRDVVDLMVALGDPKVIVGPSDVYVPKVLDACCGSGGFLISSLTRLFKSLKNLKGLTSAEKLKIESIIKLKSIYGIDAGSDPSMYKIARMNMYLHGDGGSNIFYADSLDKNIGKIGNDDLEVDRQIEELRELLIDQNIKFDLILSNPPFSLQYTRDNKDQSDILNEYVLSRDSAGGRIIKSLISSVMFIERYKDLVSDNGLIIAVIDDSVLSGESYRYIRNYIRENFIIKGIISLPGDAFRRASARVKTSIILLKKKMEKIDTQEDVFMASSIYLGLDKKTAKRIGVDYKNLDVLKQEEMSRLIKDYRDYCLGNDSEYVIPFENCLDRLDVKYCINDRGRKVPIWLKKGYQTDQLGNILAVAKDRDELVSDTEQYQLLVVNYEGEIVDGDILDGTDSSYSKLFKVQTWDILISNMGFGRGAISIVPPYHSGKFVSNEYTILTASSKEHAVFYGSILRTKEILGDVFSSTTGMNRGRIKWDIISTVLVPIYEENDEIKELTIEIEAFWNAYEKFNSRKLAHINRISKDLEIADESSYRRWLSFKPPE